MRKWIVVIGVMVLGFSSGPAVAGSNGSGGFMLGAGGGAVMGQAIGRNTEATLLGAAIGGVLGYVIGNEMDKNGVASAYGTVRPYRRPPVEYRHHRPQIRPRPWQRYSDWHQPRRNCESRCRPAEILAMVGGVPERIETTVCLDGNGDWVVVADQPAPAWDVHRQVYRQTVW